MAYLTGYLKAGGYTDVVFIDAMTHHLSEEQVRARLVELDPDVVGSTAITPAIYKAERILQVAKERYKDAVRLLKSMASGEVMLDAAVVPAPAASSMSVSHSAPARIFNADGLAGY